MQKIDEEPNLEANKTEGIKADSWQVLPDVEGLINSMKSI
jgi:hypothetical protein